MTLAAALLLCAPLAAAPSVTDLRWVVPSEALPAQAAPSRSNNNLALARHGGRLYLAFRTAPLHFASPKARLVVVSSPDLGETWAFEGAFKTGRDLREPQLVSHRGRLFLYFSELGRNPFAFQPRGVRVAERLADGRWTQPVAIGRDGELAWEVKARRGKVWKTSYEGGHYGLGRSRIRLYLDSSRDGLLWEPAGRSGDPVYEGGVSEASVEFDRDGTLWALTRNEDGDESGWGSAVAFAPPGAPGLWAFPAASDPERYDSPRLFAHKGELYALARRDLGGPFDRGWRRLPFAAQKWLYMARYWLTPKRTALFRLDRETRKLVHLLDLPSAGDTAFPAVLPLGPDTVLIANYTSPPEDGGRSWVRGQLGRTGIYLAVLKL